MRIKFLQGAFAVLFIAHVSNAQTSFDRLYQRNEFGAFMNFKGAAAMADGDIVCSLSDNDQCILVRLDPAGQMEWARSYATPESNSTDGGHSLIETNDGGIVTVGLHMIGSYGKIFILKTDSDGNVLWVKGFAALSTGAEDVVEDEEGNLYILASGACSGGAFLIIKLDAAGTLIWSKTFMTPNGHGWDLDLCADGNLIMGGHLVEAGIFLPTLAKIKTDGTLLYGYAYPQTGVQFSMVHQVTELSNGNIVLSGYSAVSEHSAASLFVAMTDADGEMIWRKKIGEPGPIDGQGTAKGIVELADGTFLLTGETPDYSANIDRLFLIMDTLGNVIQANVSKAPEFNSAYNHELVQTAFGNLYSICSTSGLLVRKIPATYAMCSDSLVTPAATALEIAKTNHAMTINSSLGIVHFTTSSSPEPIKSSVECGTFLSMQTHAEDPQIDLYPNPSSGALTIHSPGGTLFLYDMRGALVATYPLEFGTTALEVHLPPNLYFWKLSAGNSTHSGKIILQ